MVLGVVRLRSKRLTGCQGTDTLSREPRSPVPRCLRHTLDTLQTRCGQCRYLPVRDIPKESLLTPIH